MTGRRQAERDVGEMTGAQRARAAEYSDAYRRGRGDAWNGTRELQDNATERQREAYERGHSWGESHPAPYGPDREAEAG